MNTRKRKRTLDSEEESWNKSHSSEIGDEDSPIDLEQDPSVINTRAKRQKKNSVICATNEEVIQATVENKQFSISPAITSLIIKNLEIEGMYAGRNLGLALSESINNITRIDIHNCSSDVIRSVLKSIKTSKKLIELLIKNEKQNATDSGEYRDLAPLLPRLQTLWLENCTLSLDTIKHVFGSVVLVGAPLKKLGIINAKLTHDDCAVIADCFAGNRGGSMKLAQLNLSHNPIKATHAIGSLVERIQPEELDLTDCQINDEGLRPLANTLHQRMIIKDLKLGKNIIGHIGLKHLKKKVNNNFSLFSLDLRGINISPICARILSKLKSKSLKTILLDVDIPAVIDLTTKNKLLDGFNNSALLQAIHSDKWDDVWNIIKQKPNVPLRYLIPLDKVPIAKVHKLHTLALDTLKTHVLDLVAKQKEEISKKEGEKERLEYLTKRKLELENELKTINEELNDMNNKQGREDMMKIREKDIETYSSCLRQTERSMQNIEREIQAWKELVKRNVADWSKNEVQMFMRNIGLNTYEGVFNQNKVTGSVLVRLSTTDFHQLGLSYPHTMRVVKALFLAKHFQSTEAPPGILHWTMNEVKDWLTKNNFQSLIATFTKTQITGSELLFLQTPDLKNWLQIDTLAERVRLEQAISTLKNSVIEGQQQPEAKPKPKVPSHFKCPITQEIMQDPVVTSDGHTYERIAIENWLANHDTSPMTNEPLANKQVHPCHYLKNMINEFLQQNQN